MELTEEQVSTSSDLLIRSSEEYEDKLSNYGFANAHDWMFALREVLYDFRRFNVQLNQVFTSDISNHSLSELREVGTSLLYEIGPHLKSHMDELIESLDAAKANMKAHPESHD